LPSEDSFSCR
jgi:hypothetical protein